MKNPTPQHALFLGALGVVFGDIGTSPLYAFRECLKASGSPSADTVFGILSLMLWSIFIVVTLKYVFFVMKADNHREGGILALMALVSNAGPAKMRYPLVLLGLAGAAMFYGDSMVTPAISVLSAVEGLKTLNPNLEHYIIPISLAILLSLFMTQKYGTALIGTYFGPAMALWFSVLAVLGIYQIAQHPAILTALSPHYAVQFAIATPGVAFAVLASVFLAVTGGEALYADMGHFGKPPIQKAWLYAVFPALILNYLGQGALIVQHPNLLEDPFFSLAPHWALAPLVLLSTIATVIASQAVLTGAFSMTQQAIALGYIPRLTVIHTSTDEIGQIYVPFVNRVLLFAVLFLVFFFKSSENLAAAYGIAVASTMMLTTLFMLVVTRYIWNWSLPKSLFVTTSLLSIDALFVSTNFSKIADGGWFPLSVGALLFTLMTTWKRGRQVVFQSIQNDNLPLAPFIKSLCAEGSRPQRVEGTAVFLSSISEVTPSSFMHNLKHNRVLHRCNIFLTIQTAQVPFLRNSERLSIQDLGYNCFAITAKIGFKESANVPHILALLQGQLNSWTYEEMDTSFFLTRESIIASPLVHSMAHWREKLFVILQRNAAKAAEYFNLPSNRVIELGTQVVI